MERKPDGYISISRKNGNVVIMIPPCSGLANGEVFEADFREVVEVLRGIRPQAKIYKVKAVE